MDSSLPFIIFIKKVREMDSRLKEMIGMLEHEELIGMRKDLMKGGAVIRSLINDQIKDNEKRHQKYCTVCASDINMGSPSNFTLIFGPDDFRKKATFCAADCLKYFINNLESLRKGVPTEKVSGRM